MPQRARSAGRYREPQAPRRASNRARRRGPRPSSSRCSCIIEKLRFQLARLKRAALRPLLGAARCADRPARAHARGSGGERGGAAVASAARQAASRPPSPCAGRCPRTCRARRSCIAAPCACPACGGELRAARRGRGRDARVRAGALQGDPPRAAQVRLRALRDARAGAGAEPADRARPGRSRAAGPCAGGKYADHLPLYRQSQIFARDGVDLDRSTLADWVGGASALLEPLVDAVGRHVLAAEQAACRRHAGAGAVPGTRHDQARDGCGPTCAMIGRPAAPIRRRCCSATRRTARANHPRASRSLPRGPAGRRLCRLRRLYGERDPGSGLLGARAAQVLRLARRARLAARRGGARADRRALRDRGRDPWPPADERRRVRQARAGPVSSPCTPGCTTTLTTCRRRANSPSRSAMRCRAGRH